MADSHEKSRRGMRAALARKSFSLEKTARQLKKRRLSLADFNAMATALRQWNPDNFTMIHRSVQKENNSVSASIAYMQSVGRSYHHLSDKVLVPQSIRLEADREKMFYTENTPPFIWDYDSVETKMLRRTGIGLDYETNDFRQVLRIGLVLSKAIGPMMEKQGKFAVPVFVPHRKGIYSGYAFRSEFSQYYPTVYFKTAFRNSTQDQTIHTDVMNKYKGCWTTSTTLVMKTFYSLADCFDRVGDLFENLRPILDDEDLNARIERIYDSYIMSEALTPEIEGDLAIVTQRLQSIMQSPEWVRSTASRIDRIAHIDASPLRPK